MKTKRLILTLLIVAGLTSIRAQDTWIQKADFGGTVRNQAVAFSIAEKGYVGTGGIYVGSGVHKYYDDFWEYDPLTNAWTQKSDYGGGARGGAVGFSIGNKGYIGTGFDSADNHYKDFWEYDPSGNVWIQRADFKGGARTGAIGFSIAGKGYIGTGFGYVPSLGYYSNEKDFWEYDPVTNKWVQKLDFGGTERYAAIGFSCGDKGYIGTGLSPNPANDFWEYNPSTNGWTQKADYGGTARQGAVGFSIGNKGYIGTGYMYDGFAHFYNDFWEYDASNNIWKQKADFGGVPSASGVGFTIDGKGFIGTGWDNSYNSLNEFWEYTPDDCGGLSVYADADDDKYGDAANNYFAADCIVPIGYVLNSTDCNDVIAAVNPGAIEVCNNIDDNCDGIIDNVNSEITFAPQMNFTTGTGSWFVAAGDLDGDGKADLVTANPIPGTISILRNASTSGHISFENKVDYQTGSGSYVVAIGDLDADGKPDLAISCYDSYSISILRNTGSSGLISFEPAGNYTTENQPYGIAIGDIDQDGIHDIAVANYGDPENGDRGFVSLYRNLSTPGNIYLAERVNIETAIQPTGVVITDIDGDGAADIAVSNFGYGPGALFVFRNLSTPGLFSFEPKIELATGDNAYCVSASDLDGDGKTDLATANLYGASITIYRNTSLPGSISFNDRIDYPTAAWFRCVVFGDLNGDGKPDMANDSYTETKGFVSVSENTSNVGSISFNPMNNFEVDYGPTWVIIQEVDGDNKPDVVSVSSFENTVSVLRNTSITGCGESCDLPSGLKTADITSNSAQLYWNDNPVAAGYVIKYNTVSGSDKAKITYSKSNSKPISGLAPGTAYFWRVKSVCSDDPKVVSDWSEKYYFTTGALKFGEKQTISLDLYPNPVSQQFTLKLKYTSVNNQSASINLLNVLGQVIYSSQEEVNGEWRKEITMPVTASSGWYILRVVLNDHVMEKKLLYQK